MAAQQRSLPIQSPYSTVFLLHVAIEAPFAFQGLLMSDKLPFLEANNTTLVMVKLFAAMSLATCIASLLVFALPEYLPGKRALALGLIVYHTIATTILYSAPRFIPVSFGDAFEAMGLHPERAWAIAHGAVSLGLAIWWQGTLAVTAAFRQQAAMAVGK